MSDRIKGFTVVLDRDYKDEDAEHLKHAIEMIRGVVKVAPSVVDPDDFMNRQKVAWEFREKLIEVVNSTS